MNETELKPCPVCGKRLIVVRISSSAWFWKHYREPILPNCPIAKSRCYPSREKLIEEMNRRCTDGKYEAGYRKQEWFDAKTNPPKKSGEVLVFTKGGYRMVVNYSVRHKAFNASDDRMSAETAIEATHWIPLPPEPKGVVDGRTD